MANRLLRCIMKLGEVATGAARSAVILYDRLKGEKSFKIVSVHSADNEAYTLHTTQGGTITLHCIERIYSLAYSAWWYPNEWHRTYMVSGTCEGDVPTELVALISNGITIGAILPSILPRERQKKEAIHVYASYLVNELEKETKN